MEKKEVIVYTYGVFDLFHSGHVELLSEAKALGDKLVVGIFSDDVVRSFKREPVISLKHRMAVVESCRYVDQVIEQKNLLPDENLRLVRPNILAKGPGAGWGGDKEVPGENVVKEISAKVVKLSYHDGISTSQIINKIINT